MTQKRTEMRAQFVNSEQDGRRIRITKEYVGMYAGLRSPTHVAELSEEEARELHAALDGLLNTPGTEGE